MPTEKIVVGRRYRLGRARENFLHLVMRVRAVAPDGTIDGVVESGWRGSAQIAPGTKFEAHTSWPIEPVS